MESCEKFELLLSQKLDNALLPEEEALLQSHLVICEDCRSLAEDLSYLQQSFSSLSADPPPSLHVRIMEQIKAEGPAHLQEPVPLVRPRSWYRRYATTAAALVLLASALAFGAKFIPLLSTEDSPSDSNVMIAEVDPQVQQRSALDEECTPQVKTADPNPSAESIQDSPNADARQSELNIASAQTPDLAADNLEGATSDPSLKQPSLFISGGALPLELTQDEAEALLREFLSDAGKTTDSLVFASPSSDGASYQFLYTDVLGTAWKYTVSGLDGSIICESP